MQNADHNSMQLGCSVFLFNSVRAPGNKRDKYVCSGQLATSHIWNPRVYISFEENIKCLETDCDVWNCSSTQISGTSWVLKNRCDTTKHSDSFAADRCNYRVAIWLSVYRNCAPVENIALKVKIRLYRNLWKEKPTENSVTVQTVKKLSAFAEKGRLLACSQDITRFWASSVRSTFQHVFQHVIWCHLVSSGSLPWEFSD
jgi:hypothetical protein